MKERTLLFLRKPEEKEILLAMKKRGFGEGKWNGVGGKVETGESVEEAVVREATEEIGVKVEQTDLRQVAILDFVFVDQPEFNQRVHTFFTEKWTGEPVESEEMRPKWYATDALPYDFMWVDDPHWLPLVLAGKTLKASFTFGDSGATLLSAQVNEINA